MPGIYGSVTFVMGAPESPKPVNSAPCVVCGKTVYRQTFRVGHGWCWRCYGCDPDKVYLERRHAAGTYAPMGYVPSNYERQEEKTTAFDPAMAAAIRRSRGES